MTNELQRASAWKRISAFIFDSILTIIVAVGVAFLLTTALRYDAHAAEREQLRQSYQTEYGVSFDITADEYGKLSEQERQKIDDAYYKFATDPAVNQLDAVIVNLTLIIIVFGVLVPFIIFEFIIPLALGHGRTLGKKIFGIAVVREDSVRISTFQLFARSILGKYTLETMIPIFLILAILFNVMSIVALVGLAAILAIQAGLLLFSRLHAPIHDAIAGTVAVDFASQRIFDTSEQLLEYTKQQAAEAAQKAEYR